MDAGTSRFEGLERGHLAAGDRKVIESREYPFLPIALEVRGFVPSWIASPSPSTTANASSRPNPDFLARPGPRPAARSTQCHAPCNRMRRSVIRWPWPTSRRYLGSGRSPEALHPAACFLPLTHGAPPLDP